jgi:hypothetical protein
VLTRRPDPLEPGDRLWLAALSRLVPRRRLGEVFTVTPATVLAWHRRHVAQVDYTSSWRPGWPSTTAAIRKLVIRSRRASRGHRRVQGELRRPGHPIAASTVRQILHDVGISPRALPQWPDLEAAQSVPVLHARGSSRPRFADTMRLMKNPCPELSANAKDARYVTKFSRKLFLSRRLRIPIR